MWHSTKNDKHPLLSRKLIIRTVRRKSTSLIPNFALPSRNSDFLGHDFLENFAFLKMTPDSPLSYSRTRAHFGALGGPKLDFMTMLGSILGRFGDIFAIKVP